MEAARRRVAYAVRHGEPVNIKDYGYIIRHDVLHGHCSRSRVLHHGLVRLELMVQKLVKGPINEIGQQISTLHKLMEKATVKCGGGGHQGGRAGQGGPTC